MTAELANGLEGLRSGVDVLVDTHLAMAGITVTAEEREMFIDDFPILRESTEKLYAFGDGLEPVLVFDPNSVYSAQSR